MEKVTVRPVMHPDSPIDVRPDEAAVLRARGLLAEDAPAKPPRAPRAPRAPKTPNTPAGAKTAAPAETPSTTEGNTPS